jgi:hypothetical protein
MLLTEPEHKEMCGKELYDFFHSPFLQVVLGDKIKQGKQEDPYKVNQMPV